MGGSDRAPWAEAFRDDAHPDRAARILLEQVDARWFALGSSLRFTPPFDLPDVPDAALRLRPEHLAEGAGERPLTDLASVPVPLRWFVGTYGVHTPAALIHDRLIGATGVPGVDDASADRLFRRMLEALGVPFLRRWLMWAAVAFGTRWRAGGVRKALVAAWAVLALGGMATFAWALVAGLWIVAAVAAVAPVPAAALWGPQYGAGLVAAYSAVWLAPPTVLGAVGYGVYWMLEKALAVLIHAVGEEPLQGRDPMPYREF